MALIKNGEIAADPWVRLEDAAPLPASGAVLVSYVRWQQDRDELSGRNAPLGIVLASDEPPSLIAEDLGRFDLIALAFPTNRDGRAFSYARLLRDRYGYKGEIRAVGHIIRDQLLFLQRAGFDAVEIPATEERALAAWRKALSEISVFYQDSHDGRAPVWRRRHGL